MQFHKPLLEKRGCAFRFEPAEAFRVPVSSFLRADPMDCVKLENLSVLNPPRMLHSLLEEHTAKVRTVDLRVAQGARLVLCRLVVE
jgi:hypothetical protein